MQLVVGENNVEINRSSFSSENKPLRVIKNRLHIWCFKVSNAKKR